jgi:ABC-type multidrug transport system fused ATPase/permease subunit
MVLANCQIIGIFSFKKEFSMSSFSQLRSLISSKQKKIILLLLFPMALTALFNIVGVAFIMPFLAVVAQPSVIHNNAKLHFLYDKLHFSSDLNFTIFIGCAAFVVLIVANSFSILTTWLSSRATFSVSASLKKTLYKKYLESNYEFHMNINSSTLISNLFVLVPGICVRYILPGVLAISSMISIVAIVALIYYINPAIAGVMTGCFGSIYLVMFKMTKKKVARNSKEIVLCREKMHKYANESFGGIKEIKLRQREGVFLDVFDKKAVFESKRETFNQVIAVAPKYVLEMIAFGGVVLMILFMLLAGKGVASIISTMALYVYAGYRLMPALQQVFFGFSSMRAVSADIEKLYRSANSLAVKKEMGELTPNDLPFSRSLQLKNISYRYPEHQKLVLNDVNLTVNFNETVGIIGSTGAGKTTLIDIVLGLLRPTQGGLYVDGEELSSDQDIAAWQQKIGYVSQHIFLADSSIRENIAFGLKKEEIDEDRVKESAKMAAISDYIENQAPDGYDTVVGERGVRLSGGQMQRIGIARALYHKPSVLVLDEATSALDNNTEKEVMRAIYGMKDKITMIVIAHRLTTVAACDRIYNLSNGQVVAEAESLEELGMLAD